MALVGSTLIKISSPTYGCSRRFLRVRGETTIHDHSDWNNIEQPTVTWSIPLRISCVSFFLQLWARSGRSGLVLAPGRLHKPWSHRSNHDHRIPEWIIHPLVICYIAIEIYWTMAIEIVSFPTKNGVVYSLLLNYTGVGRRIPQISQWTVPYFEWLGKCSYSAEESSLMMEAVTNLYIDRWTVW